MLRQQEQRHNRCLVDISQEKVVLFEPHQGLDAGLPGVLLSLADAYRVDIDPNSAGSVVLGGSNDNTAITAAEVYTMSDFFAPASFSIA